MLRKLILVVCIVLFLSINLWCVAAVDAKRTLQCFHRAKGALALIRGYSSDDFSDPLPPPERGTDFSQLRSAAGLLTVEPLVPHIVLSLRDRLYSEAFTYLGKLVATPPLDTLNTFSSIIAPDLGLLPGRCCSVMCGRVPSFASMSCKTLKIPQIYQLTARRFFSSPSCSVRTAMQNIPQACVSILVKQEAAFGDNTFAAPNLHEKATYLMVQRGRPPALGMWSFPGGRINLGERTYDAARRELYEECALSEAEVALWPNPFFSVDSMYRDENMILLKHYVISVVYGWTKHANTSARAHSDAADVCWMTREEISNLLSKKQCVGNLLEIIDYSNKLISTNIIGANADLPPTVIK